MWPRTGIVIGSAAGLMTIRLNNGGAKVGLANTKQFKLGDTAHVLWDFTHNRPADIWTDEEYHADPEDEGAVDAAEHPGDWLPDEHWKVG